MAWYSKISLSIAGKDTADGAFDWADALIDASILTGVTVAAALGVAFSDGALSIQEIGALVSAGLLEFCGFLAAKRKIKKPEKEIKS